MKKRLVMLALMVAVGVTTISCGKKSEVQTIPFETGDEENDVKKDEIETDETEAEDAASDDEESVEDELEVREYTVCTDKSAEEVEAFAADIVSLFKKEDWKGLAKCVYYPITINDTYYESEKKFLQTDWSNTFSKEYIDDVVNAETTNLFANWQGIMLSDGCIWFGEVDNELKVISINYYDGTAEADYSNGPVGHWVFDLSKTQEALKNHSDVQEMFGSGIHAGADFELATDQTFSMDLALAFYIQGTYEIDGDNIIISYESQYPEQPGVETVRMQTIDNKLYLISEYDGEEIYWTKLAE